MDVVLTPKSVFELPSSQRVGAIFHAGAMDFGLWPADSLDRDLKHAYGDTLQEVLDKEREKAGGALNKGDIVRLHPGRLHCDFLIWIASREPEPGSEPSQAPDEEFLKASILAGLRFAAERDVEKVAFSALGEGKDALTPTERLEIVIKTAHEYQQACFKESTSPGIEQVLVCHPEKAVITKLKRRAGALAKASDPDAAKKKKAKKKKAKAKTKRKTTRKPRETKPNVTEEQALEHAASPPYSMSMSYTTDDWIVHSKFGVGRVLFVDGKSATVVFQEEDVRRLVHGRE